MENFDKQQLAELVRNFRRRANLSQEKLAQMLDVSLHTIWRIENNEGGKITLDTIYKLSNIFNTDLIALLAGHRSPRPETKRDRIKMIIDHLSEEQTDILLGILNSWKLIQK